MTGSTWYSAQGSWLREFWTLLHLPYTLMAICFVLIGISLNRPIDLPIAGLLCLAYFLGLGIAAHCFDQLPGQGTVYVKIITPLQLQFIGVGALGVAVGVGISMATHLHLWIIIPCMIVQTFFAFAYPMKQLFRGYFHTNFWFAVGFGAIPFTVGYLVSWYTSPVHTTVFPAVWAIACLCVSYIEILLSRHVRYWRKTSPVMHHAGREFTVDEQLYTGSWKRAESALKLLCLTVYLVTIAMLVG
jgi:hypothetical protein